MRQMQTMGKVTGRFSRNISVNINGCDKEKVPMLPFLTFTLSPRFCPGPNGHKAVCWFAYFCAKQKCVFMIITCTKL